MGPRQNVNQPTNNNNAAQGTPNTHISFPFPSQCLGFPRSQALSQGEDNELLFSPLTLQVHSTLNLTLNLE